MTYILQHKTPARFEAQSLVRSARRICVTPVAIVARVATGITRSVASAPSAIAKAFTMAYIDPFQPARRADDPTDPQNF